MGFLDIFSLFVLLVILALVVAILLLLAWLPGDLAKKRHSPWAEAINVAGWIGILLPPLRPAKSRRGCCDCAGASFPIKKHTELEPYYQHFNQTGCTPNQKLENIGLKLNLYF